MIGNRQSHIGQRFSKGLPQIMYQTDFGRDRVINRKFCGQRRGQAVARLFIGLCLGLLGVFCYQARDSVSLEVLSVIGRCIVDIIDDVPKVNTLFLAAVSLRIPIVIPFYDAQHIIDPVVDDLCLLIVMREILNCRRIRDDFFRCRHHGLIRIYCWHLIIQNKYA